MKYDGLYNRGLEVVVPEAKDHCEKFFYASKLLAAKNELRGAEEVLWMKRQVYQFRMHIYVQITFLKTHF